MTSHTPMESIRVLDSATKLAPADRGAVVVCGSHGGTFPAWLAARAGVRAIVLNDAGLGLDRAGVAGVAWLDALGIARPSRHKLPHHWMALQKGVIVEVSKAIT